MAAVGLGSCAAAPRASMRFAPRLNPAAMGVQPVSLTASPWPRRDVLDLALQAYRCGRALGYIDRPLLTVIDYSLPSTTRRLWVIDIAHSRVLFNELVAHGERSGEDVPIAFSNRVGSRQSSLGLFRAEDVYDGEHGLSLRLDGLEPGINDQARDRRIVMHGAPYVSEAFIAEHGRLGRSWGCPALPAEIHEQLIDSIRDGSAVFAFYPDPEWLQSSRFLHCDATRITERDMPRRFPDVAYPRRQAND
jgi:hypothetical protein